MSPSATAETPATTVPDPGEDHRDVDTILDGRARRELWGWAALAILALALAGVAALLIAASRTPGIRDLVPWPTEFFLKGLVAHVVFSFVVWFLATFGALLHLAAWRAADRRPRLETLGRAGLWAATAAMPLLFAPTLLERGEPVLNNYVPVIADPVYYAGLALLAAGVALAAVRTLANVVGRRERIEPFAFGLAAAAVTYFVALACVALAFASLAGEPASHAFNEELFWGGGHVLQFVNASIMLAAWAVLARIAWGRPVLGPGTYRLATLWLLAFTLPAPFLYGALVPFSAEQTETFTNLQYALAPPLVLVAVATARGTGWRQPPEGGRNLAYLCLVLSVAVFAMGGLLGLFVDGTDTRTPAHYHGVIAGITLAIMGLYYALFLPLLGCSPGRGRALYVQVWLFASGQTVAALGLFLAGSFGEPRKTMGAVQGLEGWGTMAGMALNGAGAVFAVVGGVMFIWTAARALARVRSHLGRADRVP